MFHVKRNAQVVVIGGGHAGCEASLAAARMGVSTLLITMAPNRIAEMSCNPSIGGVGKGQLVKEIDALGGEMGRNADFTGIQFKRLNTRKGSAVQSSRCQSDKKLYAERMQRVISQQKGLEVLEGEVKLLHVEQNRVVGLQVQAKNGERVDIECAQIVITAGTFMAGLMHCGSEQSNGGRFGESPSIGLSKCLGDLGFRISRLKTGTPPRLLRDSIDFSLLEEQPGDAVPYRFSFFDSKIPLPQVPCYLGYTNTRTHEAIRSNLDRSPLYSGKIQGIGPRYCPSIEDKVVKFPTKDRHPIFFEPESLTSDWIYPNGVSTSLPKDVQESFIRTLPGCEKVEFARFGYAVEYDCIDPRQLKPTLEAREIGGLFLAGQVNGTSGYEEAAAQGLLAGINAALNAKEAPPFHLSRAESYIGVMVDDLTTLGVTEPYRMFTSRAEFRLSLREDNADVRLSPRGNAIGLLTDEDFSLFERRQTQKAELARAIRGTTVKPTDEAQALMRSLGSSPLYQAQTVEQLVRRPELGLRDLSPFFQMGEFEDPRVVESVEIEIKYAGYIEMQRQEIDRLHHMRAVSLPETLDFAQVAGLSTEIREKLRKFRPKSLAEAAQIPGVTPSALSSLLFHVKQKGPSPATGTI